MVDSLEPLILIVEDEPAQLEVLSYNISAAGFRVVTANSGDEALLKTEEEEPDLIVLDWMLPGVSGIEICRRLRGKDKTRATPIIMVSARGEEGDKVLGLESGADDYVSKPYSISELIARIRANLRRVRPASTGQMLEFGGITLNNETYRVTRDDDPLKLGPIEFRLLSTLMEKPGKVWSREALLDRVWGRDIHVDDRTVDVHVGRLRKALRSTGHDDPIRTVRGAGYSLG